MRWLAYAFAGLFVLMGLASIGAGDGAAGLAMTIIGVGVALGMNQAGNQYLQRVGREPYRFEVPATVYLEVNAKTEKQAKRMVRETLELDETVKGVKVAGIEFAEEGK